MFFFFRFWILYQYRCFIFYTMFSFNTLFFSEIAQLRL
uniref:Uncharacterized protein n=1 Tax=Rhizophora mucronata TaxID=61149 RepID=A0A2P2NP56_RHIMU